MHHSSQGSQEPHLSFLDSRGGSDAWSTGSPAWSPLLMLGGSVVAAVMLIGTGLSMLGTEPELPAGATAESFAQRFAAERKAPAVAVVAVVELKTLRASPAESR